MDRLELMEVNGAYPTPAQVDAEMPNFIARCQEMIAEHYQKHLTNIIHLTPQVYVAGGRKYIKVATRGLKINTVVLSSVLFVPKTVRFSRRLRGKPQP